MAGHRNSTVSDESSLLLDELASDLSLVILDRKDKITAAQVEGPSQKIRLQLRVLQFQSLDVREKGEHIPLIR